MVSPAAPDDVADLLRAARARVAADPSAFARPDELLDALDEALRDLESGPRPRGCALGALTILSEVSAKLRARLDVEERLDHVLGVVCHAFSADSAAILLREGERLVVRAVRGVEAKWRGARLSADARRTLAGRVLRAPRVVVFDDPRVIAAHAPHRGARLRALALAPLSGSDGVLGALHVGTCAERRFVDAELSLLELVADRVAMTLESERARGEKHEQVVMRTRASEHATELRRAKEVVERMKDGLDRSQRAARVGSWDWDLGTGRIQPSDECRRQLGLPEGTLAPETIVLSVHPADRDRVRAAIDATLRGEPQELVHRVIRADGSVGFARMSTELVRDERGAPWRVVATLADVTERVRAEEAQHLLVEAAAALSSSLDVEELLRKLTDLVVPRLASLAVTYLVEGRDAHEIAARAATDGAPEGGPLVDALSAATRAVLEEHAAPGLVTGAALGERERALGLRARLVLPLVARGHAVGALALGAVGDEPDVRDVALAREIAALAALYVDNALLYRAAQEASRRREEVLAIVSHDLRNPLGAIRTTAFVLGRVKGEDETARHVHELAGRVLRAVDRMDRLIRDLLDLASIEAGRLAVDVGDHDADRILDEAVELMGPAAAERGLSFGRGGPVGRRVRCDRDRALQVLSNLVGNAIKFTEPGGSIRVGAHAEPGRVVFEVSDTGRGIPPEQLPHVFDRYWQVRAGDRGQGIGLGLAIAKGIVQAHGGSIHAESELGRGTTVRFDLPEANA